MATIGNLNAIDSQTVNEVVVGAMALLIDGEAYPVTTQDDQTADVSDISVAVYCDELQQSAVILRCSHPLAVQLTSAMLEIDPKDIMTADLLDATGEVVNVIAGNLRGLLTNPGTMTPPFLLEKDAFDLLGPASANSYNLHGQNMQVLRF